MRLTTRLHPAPVHATAPNLDMGIADFLGCAGVKKRHRKLFGVGLEACRKIGLRLDECATSTDLSVDVQQSMGRAAWRRACSALFVVATFSAAFRTRAASVAARVACCMC